MLTEQRYQKIMDIVDSKKTVTVLELVKALKISESTVRRDLVSLDKLGKLIRVHGGATALDLQYDTFDEDIQQRGSFNMEQKHTIGRYAAKLILPGDFVYLDSGTTVETMATYITEKMQAMLQILYDKQKHYQNIIFQLPLLAAPLKLLQKQL